MAETSQYTNLINDIIAKQMVILGPDIVLVKAGNVVGLKVDKMGKVTGIDGDPDVILQKLIDEFVGLSGQIVKNILAPVFAKYPEIKIAI
jgi:hypothetical protein